MGNVPFGLSDQYWEKLSQKDQALYGLIRPQPKAAYTVDIGLDYLEEFLSNQERDLVKMGGRLELEPDFQRGHVWGKSQRMAFIEALLRGTAPTNILFNCPGWQQVHDDRGDIPEYTFQCVDGLQRLTSVRKFMAGEFPVFNDIFVDDLAKTPFDPRRYRFKFSVYEFTNRVDLLTFYLDLNTGGTVHDSAELERVRQLLEAVKPVDATDPPVDRQVG